MSLLTRSANASIDANQANQILAGLIAGEALDPVSPCYIKTSDGMVYMSNATGTGEAAEVVGFNAAATAAGNPVTLFGPFSRFQYGTGLTIGNVYYLAATAGRLDTAATVGDAFGYAMAISATDIITLHSMPVRVSATVGAGTITVAELGNDAVETAKIKNVNVTQAKIEVGSATAGLTGLIAKFVAAGNVIGGIPVVQHVLVAAGANGDTDVTLTHKTRVMLCIVHPRSSVASATLQVKNAGNVLSDAMVAAVSGALTLSASLVAAQDTIAAGAVLRVTGAGGATQPDADVYVIGFRVA